MPQMPRCHNMGRRHGTHGTRLDGNIQRVGYCEHTWQLVEIDSSEHGDIERYVCTECSDERLSHGAPDERP